MVSSPAWHRMSLSAIGTPCKAACGRRGRIGSASVAASARGGCARRRSARRRPQLDPLEVGRTPARGTRSRAHRAARRSARRSAPSVETPRSCVGGTRNAPARPVGGVSQHLVERPRRPRPVGARVSLSDRARARSARRRRGRGAESACTCSRCVESCVGHAVDLVVGQRQPRQAGDVQNVFRGDRHVGQDSRAAVGAGSERSVGSCGASRPRAGRLGDARTPLACLPLLPWRPRTRPAGPRQRLVAVALDLGEVHEHVFTAVLLDESVALLVAEPLHGAFCQLVSSPLTLPACARDCAQRLSTVQDVRNRCRA